MKHWLPLIFAALLTGCTGLAAPKATNTHLYLLEATPAKVEVKRAQTLLVGMPSAAPGFDTPQMAYLRNPMELEYFATHRWADTPARMLKPLLVQALESGFSAVAASPTLLSSHLKLETELLRLQQDFTRKPSRIQLTLRAQLIDTRDKRMIATQLFDEYEESSSEDAYGGVLATDRALQRLLNKLVGFCLSATKTK